MPIARTCYFQNLGVGITSFLPTFVYFCQFLSMPNFLFWIYNVTFRFFANFCQFLPMLNLLFWNLRGENSKVGYGLELADQLAKRGFNNDRATWVKLQMPRSSAMLRLYIYWWIITPQLTNQNKIMKQFMLKRFKSACCWTCNSLKFTNLKQTNPEQNI